MSSIRPQPAASATNSPSVASQAGKPRLNSYFRNLGWPGLLWVLAGLVLCGSFFLPWLASSLVCIDPVCTPLVARDPHFLSHYASSPTGFSIASGTFALDTNGSVGPIHEGFSFLWLWLVFLAGLVLIALPLLLALGKMDTRRTHIFLLAFCLLTLAVEIGYSVSASQALPQTRAGLAALLNSQALSKFKREAVFAFPTGPATGYWLALGATLFAAGVSAYALASASGRRFDALLFWRSLGLSGQTILLAGVALEIAFFLPWLSTPEYTASATGGYKIAKGSVTVAQTATTSGWNTAANGFTLPLYANGQCTTSCSTAHISIFLSLWLIPLVGLGLVWIAWLLGRGLLWRRIAAILACLVLLIALTLEAFFLLEVQSLQSFDEQLFRLAGQRLTGTAYSVAWGFWVTLAISGAALLVSGFLLLQRHKSVTGRLGSP